MERLQKKQTSCVEATQLMAAELWGKRVINAQIRRVAALWEYIDIWML